MLGEVSVLMGVGLDMTYAFMKFLYGDEVVDAVMNSIEYAPHTNPHWDPFSVVHNVSTVPITPTRGNGLTIHRFLAQIRTCLCWIVLVQRGIVSSGGYFWAQDSGFCGVLVSFGETVSPTLVDAISSHL